MRESRIRPGLVVLATLLVGCPAEEDAPDLVPLDSRGALIRVSTDLRGAHPTETELQAVEANPELYVEFVDRWLDDPLLLERDGGLGVFFDSF